MKTALTEQIDALVAKEKQPSEELINTLVNQILDEQTTPHMAKLQHLIAQKEIIENEIKIETQKLQDIRQESFDQIELRLKNRFGDIDLSTQKSLSKLKLQSFDILDLLREITESAYILALESNEETTDALMEISRDLTVKTLRDGYLTLDRARSVVGTIISVATELAEATPVHADAILKGALLGAQKGLIQSIEIFKERFAFIPDELRPQQIRNMQKTYQDLQHTDTLFIQVVQAQAEMSSDIINTKLSKHLDELRPELRELIKVSREALLLVGERLAKLGKGAVNRGQSVLKSKAAIEAKRMGITVWDVAKGVVGNAIHRSKEPKNKDKK